MFQRSPLLIGGYFNVTLEGKDKPNDMGGRDLDSEKCGKNSLPLDFATERSAAERLPECLLRGRHEAADAGLLPHCLGYGADEE